MCDNLSTKVRQENVDDNFLVSEDGQYTYYNEIKSNDTQVQTLAIPFDSGIREIKIVGTSTAHQPTQPNGTSNPGKPTTKGSSDQRILSTNTDKLRYGPGEIVQVFGKLYNAEGKPDSGKVIVQVVDKSNPKVVGYSNFSIGHKWYL